MKLAIFIGLVVFSGSVIYIELAIFSGLAVSSGSVIYSELVVFSERNDFGNRCSFQHICTATAPSSTLISSTATPSNVTSTTTSSNVSSSTATSSNFTFSTATFSYLTFSTATSSTSSSSSFSIVFKSRCFDFCFKKINYENVRVKLSVILNQDFLNNVKR